MATAHSGSKKILIHFCAAMFVVLTSCQKKIESNANTYISFKVEPQFQADSAFYYIQRQVNFGPRVPNTPPHKNCENYLAEFFIRLEWSVEKQTFTATAYDGTKLNLTNIIARKNLEKNKRILLCAHWDTRPYADQDHPENHYKPIDGANDGASGVAVLMEIARAIQNHATPDVGVDIILFDGEDYGQPEFSTMPKKADTWCLGSQYWAKAAKNSGYMAYYGILLDMVGAKNALFAKEGTSMYFAPSVVEKVWSTAAQLGYGHIFIPNRVEQIVDDHYYINKIAGIPTIDIIEYNPEGDTFFGSYWHTHQDNIDIIDKNTLKAVGQTVLKVLYSEQ